MQHMTNTYTTKLEMLHAHLDHSIYGHVLSAQICVHGMHQRWKALCNIKYRSSVATETFEGSIAIGSLPWKKVKMYGSKHANSNLGTVHTLHHPDCAVCLLG